MTFRKILRARDWFFSPELPPWQLAQVEELKRALPRSKQWFWMLSSGTQSVRSTKALCLTLDAMLASAESVNQHLEAGREDRWAAAIPTHFVGGLSIYARAELSGARVHTFAERWSAERFGKFCLKNKITLTSLVPTQVHDLVQAEVQSPPSLRAAIIGGGALSPELYQSARALGWPVLPSYGLTETCSQVATASLASLKRAEYPALKILKHARLRMGERLEIKATSLAKWTATLNQDGTRTLEVAAPTGWYKTADIGEVKGRSLKVLGRADDVVKINGVLVSVPEVEHELSALLKTRLCVLALPDPRSENKLVLVLEGTRSVTAILKTYNAQVPRARRIFASQTVRAIPRSEMGKVKKTELKKLLGF